MPLIVIIESGYSERRGMGRPGSPHVQWTVAIPHGANLSGHRLVPPLPFLHCGKHTWHIDYSLLMSMYTASYLAWCGLSILQYEHHIPGKLTISISRRDTDTVQYSGDIYGGITSYIK